MTRGKEEPAVPGIWHGPKTIQKTRQVGIPASIMEAVGLKIGDQVHFQIKQANGDEITITKSDNVQKASDRD